MSFNDGIACANCMGTRANNNAKQTHRSSVFEEKNLERIREMWFLIEALFHYTPYAL